MSNAVKRTITLAVIPLILLSSVCWAAESAENTDIVSGLIPADAMLVLRINQFQDAMQRIDQFVSTEQTAMFAPSMMLYSQIGMTLGNPQMTGLDMKSDAAIFMTVTQTGPVVGILFPVSNYQMLISNCTTCHNVDANDVAFIISPAGFEMIMTPVKSFALCMMKNTAKDYQNLLKLKTDIDVGQAKTFDSVLAAELKEPARTKPIWFYINMPDVWSQYGMLATGQIQAMSAAVKNAPTPSPVNFEKLMGLYCDMLKAFGEQTQSVSLSLEPDAKALKLTKTVTAVPDSNFAQILVPAEKPVDYQLLNYLHDGAVMNYAYNVQSPAFKEGYRKFLEICMDFLGDAPEQDKKTLMACYDRSFEAVGDEVVGFMSVDPNTKPAFRYTYAFKVKDVDKLNALIDEAPKMWEISGLNNFYSLLGFQAGIEISKNSDTYQDIPIHSAVFMMKFEDANAPQAAMLENMYVQGIEYKWAVVDQIAVCAAGADNDTQIKALIDQVKAGGPQQMCTEIKAALEYLPTAEKADCFGTMNYLRMMQMSLAMMPMPQAAKLNVQPKSNIVFAMDIEKDRLAFDLVLPKAHLTEILNAFMSMRAQIMQQDKIKMQQGKSCDPNAGSCSN